MCNYRIDVVSNDELVEIQHSKLAALRDKVSDLLSQNHRVLVVKPIVHRKRIVRQDAKGGEVLSRRYSPKRGGTFDIFTELVHFTRVFPHARLSLEVPIIEIEELRYPGHGRRRRWRENDFQIEDQRLVKIQRIHRLRGTRDLVGLIPAGLPKPFHTAHLAEHLEIDRGLAQQVAYCLRKTGAAKQVGKQGNSLLYELKA